MMTVPGELVLDVLRRGETVRDVHVTGLLNLRSLCEGDNLHVPVRLVGCRLDKLQAVCVQFHEAVQLDGCTVESADDAFWAAYFFAGLQIRDCTFFSDVDFQCGGHNRNGTAFQIESTIFSGFVNFFDCWFEGPVVVQGCHFLKGTNLLGDVGHPCQVQFDVSPVIVNNSGDLNLDGG